MIRLVLSLLRMWDAWYRCKQHSSCATVKAIIQFIRGEYDTKEGLVRTEMIKTERETQFSVDRESKSESERERARERWSACEH